MALIQLGGAELAERVEEAVPGSVDRWTDDTLWVQTRSISDVAGFLNRDGEFDMQYLNSISAIDYIGHFELVYHLTSFRKGHKATLRSKLPGRADLSAPSVYNLWRGADFQEPRNLGPDGHTVRRPSQHETDHALGGIPGTSSA